jgi:hypothetical protein
MTTAVESEIHIIASGGLAEAIHRSFSALAIMNGASINEPFSLNGDLWVSVSANGVGMTQTGKDEFEAYRLVPKADFPGESVSYATKISGRYGPPEPLGLYHGVQARRGGEEFVLVGPPDIFIATPQAAPVY